MFNIIIFGSGIGSNAKNIIKYFKNSEIVKVSLLVSNKPEAGFKKISEDSKIPICEISEEDLTNAKWIDSIKSKYNPDLVILAGFLKLIPKIFIDEFPDKIINLHPSLLPKWGGKGMWGENVHRKVIESGDKQSGITIHFVNDKYDKGKIIQQFKCEVSKDDTVETLRNKIQELEWQHFPKVIDNMAYQILSSKNLPDLSDKATDIPGLLPYANNIGSQPIVPQDMTHFTMRALGKVNREFSDRFEKLKSEWHDLVDDWKWNKLIWESKMGFEPLVGEIYHLYKNKNGENFISMISPKEWNREYIASFKLNFDLKWTKVEYERL